MVNIVNFTTTKKKRDRVEIFRGEKVGGRGRKHIFGTRMGFGELPMEHCMGQSLRQTPPETVPSAGWLSMGTRT